MLLLLLLILLLILVLLLLLIVLLTLVLMLMLMLLLMLLLILLILLQGGGPRRGALIGMVCLTFSQVDLGRNKNISGEIKSKFHDFGCACKP